MSRTSVLRERLASVYTESVDEVYEVVARTVRRLAPFPRVLDLGCYDGTYTARLAVEAQARETVGVELLAGPAARARAQGIEVTEADLEGPIPLPDGTFDLVHANQVIEHVRHTDGLLREMYRLTRPGGTALVCTNNLASWHNIFSLGLGYQPLPSHVSDEVHVGNPLNPMRGRPHEAAGLSHLRIFTGRALHELAERVGFEVLERGVIGYYPFPRRLARHAASADSRHAAFLLGVYRRPIPREPVAPASPDASLTPR